jgi:hypothetical protein
MDPVMATVESSISINRPVEQVFEFLVDLQNQKALNSKFTTDKHGSKPILRRNS